MLGMVKKMVRQVRRVSHGASHTLSIFVVSLAFGPYSKPRNEAGERLALNYALRFRCGRTRFWGRPVVRR